MGKKLPDLWKGFIPRLPEVSKSTGKVCYGIIQENSGKSDELTYVAATEVSEISSVPQAERMSVAQIPQKGRKVEELIIFISKYHLTIF